jgi:ABC-type glycerol-3-phosphate transport system substrate-binding protein
MTRRLLSTVAGLILMSACSGSAVSSAPEATSSSSETSTLAPATSDTLPKLIDASTDLDAIDMPIVLWFWAPG